MDILNTDKKQEFLNFIPRIKLSFAMWKLVEFKLTDNAINEGFTINDAAAKLCETFKNKSGKVYICNKHEIIALVRTGDKVSYTETVNRIASYFPEDSYDVYIHDVDEKYGLQKIEFVFIKLPIYPVEENEETKPVKVPTMAERRNRYNSIIMIADDDMFMRSMAVKGLLEKCKNVIEFVDGKDVVEGYIEHNPDILFLDIHLPYKNGIDILDDILAIDKDAYIIMFSADSSKNQVMDCLRNGAKGFVTKPFAKDKLFEFIDSCPTID